MAYQEKQAEQEKKALIAMSGGVDSSVAALLMLQAGYTCAGATMQLFQEGEACGSPETVTDAERIADRLGFPHYVFSFPEQFRDAVITPFAESYLQGATPNPCIACNRFLKFGVMLEEMHRMGFQFIVTGHYARISYDTHAGRYLLKKAVDATKDQSYVLYTLTQEQLHHVRFPLGTYQKSEIRQIAEKNGFLNARKKDSQDICFVPDGDYAGFLERFTGKKSETGLFLDTQGNILGQHKGIIHYTIGQRRGMGIAAPTPLYVCDIRPECNQIIVGQNQDLYADTLIAEDVNLISVDSLKQPVSVCAKIRYRHPEQPAVAWQDEAGLLHVQFKQPQRAITKGQAVVLYQGDVVVGGGTICGLSAKS